LNKPAAAGFLLSRDEERRYVARGLTRKNRTVEPFHPVLFQPCAESQLPSSALLPYYL
jgi:hypothetical protein